MAWRSSPDDLEAQAESEGLQARSYLQEYVWKGWGGTPELDILDYLYGLDVIVINKKSEVILVSANPE